MLDLWRGARGGGECSTTGTKDASEQIELAKRVHPLECKIICFSFFWFFFYSVRILELNRIVLDKVISELKLVQY